MHPGPLKKHLDGQPESDIAHSVFRVPRCVRFHTGKHVFEFYRPHNGKEPDERSCGTLATRSGHAREVDAVRGRYADYRSTSRVQ